MFGSCACPLSPTGLRPGRYHALEPLLTEFRRRCRFPFSPANRVIKDSLYKGLCLYCRGSRLTDIKPISGVAGGREFLNLAVVSAGFMTPDGDGVQTNRALRRRGRRLQPLAAYPGDRQWHT